MIEWRPMMLAIEYELQLVSGERRYLGRVHRRRVSCYGAVYQAVFTDPRFAGKPPETPLGACPGQMTLGEVENDLAQALTDAAVWLRERTNDGLRLDQGN